MRSRVWRERQNALPGIVLTVVEIAGGADDRAAVVDEAAVAVDGLVVAAGAAATVDRDTNKSATDLHRFARII
jgi:hypothetical protein